MENIFEGLTPQEQEKLVHSVAWVTVLIAGADGQIESEELDWATKITRIRGFSGADDLIEFYSEVGKDFEEHLTYIVENTTKDREERTKIAISHLKEINFLLDKLHPKHGAMIYNSLKSFAKHVAKASGGFLRMWAISYEEMKYIDLPMLDPIIYVEDEDSDENA